MKNPINERYICEKSHTWKCTWDADVFRTPFERQDCCPTCMDDGDLTLYAPATARVLSPEEYRELLLESLSEQEKELYERRVPMNEMDQTEPGILWGDGTGTTLEKKKEVRH